MIYYYRCKVLLQILHTAPHIDKIACISHCNTLANNDTHNSTGIEKQRQKLDGNKPYKHRVYMISLVCVLKAHLRQVNWYQAINAQAKSQNHMQLWYTVPQNCLVTVVAK